MACASLVAGLLCIAVHPVEGPRQILPGQTYADYGAFAVLTTPSEPNELDLAGHVKPLCGTHPCIHYFRVCGEDVPARSRQARFCTYTLAPFGRAPFDVTVSAPTYPKVAEAGKAVALPAAFGVTLADLNRVMPPLPPSKPEKPPQRPKG